MRVVTCMEMFCTRRDGSLLSKKPHVKRYIQRKRRTRCPKHHDEWSQGFE